MKLLFMKTSTSDLPFTLERQMVKTGLLLTETFITITPTLEGISVYRNREKATDRNIITNYKHYFSNLGVGHSAEDLDNFIDNFLKLKSKKFKNKEDIINLGRMENSFKILETDVNNATVKWMEQNHIEPLLNFTTDLSLKIFDETVETQLHEFFFVSILIEEFRQSDLFHFFGNKNPVSKENKIEEIVEADWDSKMIYSTPLFEIPCLDTLTYAQLKIIRNEFHEHLQPFFEAIEDMKSKFQTYILTNENVKEIDKEFDSVIEPQRAFLKEFIGNNIYFQQIANSSKDHKVYQLKISFASMDSVLIMIEKAKVINEMEREQIRYNVRSDKDLNTCYVFFQMAEIAAE
jgi:hypothetical protein